MQRLNWWKMACAVCVLCAVTPIVLAAQTFRTLNSFDGTDGAVPEAGLLQATNGYLYGTTAGGGVDDFGTVFRIAPGGSLTTLYSFCARVDCLDGASPTAGLLEATDGNFYGTTYFGGANSSCTDGCGTVFKITSAGMLTTLYSFCSQSGCTDGQYPRAGLVQGPDGNFYGTTLDGGADRGGTVFKITPSGTLTTLYSFCSQGDCVDGSEPEGQLVQAADGSLYGTTMIGGANDGGTVFRIAPSGTLTTLYSFCSQVGCTDGDVPDAGLVQATGPYMYGTTAYGGVNDDGTVFRITLSGDLTTLHNFGGADGATPYAGLVQGTDGNLYGTTEKGGANSDGTVFKMAPGGRLTTLQSLDESDGANPYAGLVQDTDGIFYGTTRVGGSYSDGTVFSLSVGLGPFVKTLPSSRPVGAPVAILGSNLTGATSVTFNGTAATFTVVSPSLITTTVPVGATTGKVQVVTPGGTLSSNLPFRVIP